MHYYSTDHTVNKSRFSPVGGLTFKVMEWLTIFCRVSTLCGDFEEKLARLMMVISYNLFHIKI